MSADPDPAGSRSAELRVPAERAFVATLRTLSAGLAARCDLLVDEIEDFRIAVDEACALLLPHARPDSSLTARFELAPGRLEVEVAVPADASADPDRSGFAWAVLNALADRAEVRSEAGELIIALHKQRATQQQQ